MQVTKKRLKQIIQEEMKRIDEGFGRHMAGETHRTAAAFDQEAIWHLAMAFKMILDDPQSPAAQAINNIQHPRDMSIIEALKMALRPNFMQESKKGK